MFTCHLEPGNVAQYCDRILSTERVRFHLHVQLLADTADLQRDIGVIPGAATLQPVGLVINRFSE